MDINTVKRIKELGVTVLGWTVRDAAVYQSLKGNVTILSRRYLTSKCELEQIKQEELHLRKLVAVSSVDSLTFVNHKLSKSVFDLADSVKSGALNET